MSAADCTNCGAPLDVEGSACAYCGTVTVEARAAAKAQAAEFGPRSHAFFWTCLALFAALEVATGLALEFGRYRPGGGDREALCWGLMFGAWPALLLVPGVLWGPRRGKWVSGLFLILPAAAVLLVQFLTTPMSGDDLGFAAVLLAASWVFYYLGAGLHVWIRSVRSAG